ncbi:MAG: hypothetical protein FWE07_07215 [Turicibacter sp.]|nr:hypothetical protein [Turicibacter sp.]
MKKKIKWIVVGVVVVTALMLVYLAELVRYAGSEMAILNNFTASIEQMPEVNVVEEIHRFNGLESYIVALVELTNNERAYFFIRDGSLQHYIDHADVLMEAQAIGIARGVVDGQLHHIQLGILDGTPIFEVQMMHESALHFIIVRAEEGTVWMDFSLY